MSKIAVVGGAGFIGSRLADLLDAPIVIDRSLPPTVRNGFEADVRQKDRLRLALRGVHTIYLLAAEHADNVEPISLYRDVNVGGAENVVAVAEEHEIQRIVFTSTVAVYGLNAPGASEEMPPDPFNEYSRSKCEAERRLVTWAEEDTLRSLVIVRPCVVFGEGNRGNLYNLLKQLHSRRFLMVGKGRNKKSLAYVGNLVRFMERLAAFPSGIHVINYADKPDLEIAELLSIAARELGVSLPRISVPYTVGLAAGSGFDFVSRLTGRRFPVSAVRVRKFCAVTTVNTDRLASTGFVSPYSLEEGLRRTIRADFLSNGG